MTTHEVCFNAIADVVAPRSKSGNVVSSWGLVSVVYSNWASTDITWEVSGLIDALADVTRVAFGPIYDSATYSICVCGTADAATLCGGVGSTCNAAENSSALATEIGAGNRYAHSYEDVLADCSAVTAANLKI